MDDTTAGKQLVGRVTSESIQSNSPCINWTSSWVQHTSSCALESTIHTLSPWLSATAISTITNVALSDDHSNPVPVDIGSPASFPCSRTSSLITSCNGVLTVNGESNVTFTVQSSLHLIHTTLPNDVVDANCSNDRGDVNKERFG